MTENDGVRNGRSWLATLSWGTVIRCALFLFVAWFVTLRGIDLWRESRPQSVRVNFLWLIPAAAANLAGWIPSLWLWRKLLEARGWRVPYLELARAYFAGHLAKYVPGKALVLVARAGLIRHSGAPPGAAALTTAYETLATMGIGGIVALALAPSLFPKPLPADWPEIIRRIWDTPVLFAGLIVLILIAALPSLSRLIAWTSTKMFPARLRDRIQWQGIRTRQLTVAILVISVGWALQGLSLGFTIRSISDDSFRLADWPMWTAAVSLATAAGFAAVFAPAGLGVREGMLMEALSAQPHIAPQTAVLASFVLRAVWLAAEILSAGILYWLVKPQVASREPL